MYYYNLYYIEIRNILWMWQSLISQVSEPLQYQHIAEYCHGKKK